MFRQRSVFGASLVVAAVAAFGFAPQTFAAGGGQNGGGGGSGAHASGGYSGGHYAGGLAGGRSSFGGGGRSSGVSPSIAPSSRGHFSSSVSGSSSRSTSGSPAARPSWSSANPGWQNSVNNWNRGQYYGNYWRWSGSGNYSNYPYYFAFVPLFYGGYGYLYPYYNPYADPYSYYALYGGGDAGLPPLPPAGDIGPPLAAGANPAPNAVAQNPVPPNAAPPGPMPPNAAAPNAAGAAVADVDDADGSAGAEFFAQAESAFRDGHYRDALRLANHAAVESPRNPKAHELMSLSMFALGDYRDAAIEAHAAIALGPIADWATVFGYYGDQARYTTQLRALEKYSREHPKSGEARFLRAYQYLMTGHIDAAKEQLAEAVKLTPNDKLAAELLKKYEANGGAAGTAPAPPPPAAVPPAKPVDPDGFDS